MEKKRMLDINEFLSELERNQGKGPVIWLRDRFRQPIPKVVVDKEGREHLSCLTCNRRDCFTVERWVKHAARMVLLEGGVLHCGSEVELESESSDEQVKCQNCGAEYDIPEGMTIEKEEN